MVAAPERSRFESVNGSEASAVGKGGEEKDESKRQTTQDSCWSY